MTELGLVSLDTSLYLFDPSLGESFSSLAASVFQILSSLLLYPAVYFLYDLSPITVTIREERRSFLHFITRLCAVLGGTFALTGLSFFSL